eukprot:scaffold3527_cov73-Isochrysis_galbana.AAC.1
MARLALLLWLLLLQVDGSFAAETSFAEPEVEESELSRRDLGTHAGGRQYDYVQPEADRAQVAGPMPQVVRLELDEVVRAVGGGVKVDVSNLLRALLQPGSTAKLVRSLQLDGSGAGGSHAEQRPRPPRRAVPLPAVEAGAPLVEVLRLVETTL